MAVTEEVNVDEAITAEYKAINKMEIYLKEQLNTKISTMSIAINNINTFKNINKVYTTLWREIYEVIQPIFFK